MPRGYDHYPEPEDALYDEPCCYDDNEEAWHQHAMYRHYQRAWEEDDRGLQEPQWDNLVESPEKQAVFQNLLARFQAQLPEFHGNLSVTEGERPGCRDIHLYVDHIYLDNITDDNFFRDLAQAAEMVVIRPYPLGIHAQFGIPYYDFEP